VDFAGATDVGRIRKNNEDALAILPDLALFGVADGMGGHAAGEVAARIAIETVASVMREKEARRVLDRFPKDPSLASRHAMFALLRSTFQKANDAVRAAGERRRSDGRRSTSRSSFGTARSWRTPGMAACTSRGRRRSSS
jgi:serine/threonine protein phosphatase PrpC